MYALNRWFFIELEELGEENKFRSLCQTLTRAETNFYRSCTKPSLPFYARADLVRANDGGGFWLMELELIEPSLFQRMDAGAPERFARGLQERVSGTVQIA